MNDIAIHLVNNDDSKNRHTVQNIQAGNKGEEITDMATVRLVITSHSHSPPLHPAPDLKYDLRSVPNPPKNIRDRYTGLDKRLREAMRSERKFIEMLERAEREVREAVEDEGAGDRKEHGSTTEADVINGADEKDPPKDSKIADFVGSFETCENDEEDTDDEHRIITDQVEADDHAAQPLTFRISAFCAAGQHRSVAFACELAQRDWPKEWMVEVIHRDLGRKKEERKGGRGARGKVRVGGNRGRMSVELRDD